MKKINIIILIISLALISSAFAQNKYAVLITGDPKPRGNVPPGEQWPGGDGENNEFWNDTFLFHEMLVTKFNYSEQNVHVLYAGGSAYNPLGYPARYVSGNFVDDASSTGNVMQAFQSLQSTMNEHDFLFVWVFSHGWKDQFGEAYFYLNDTIMTATTFASLINPIPAAKKVIWMQPCSGGAFAEKFVSQTNIIFTSAAHPNDIAHRADDLDTNGVNLLPDYEENEQWNYYYPCNHGEFDFHMYSATIGKSPKRKFCVWEFCFDPFFRC